MNFAEIFGWMSLYLLTGVMLMPFVMLTDKVCEAKIHKHDRQSFVLLWPGWIVIVLLVLWLEGWDEWKNY